MQFKQSSLALVTIGTFGQNCKIGNVVFGNVVFGNVSVINLDLSHKIATGKDEFCNADFELGIRHMLSKRHNFKKKL